MINTSPSQLLDIWIMLEEAYRGKSDYDGHTTEIYRYRVQPYSFLNESVDTKNQREAERTLLSIYELFAEKRDAVVEMVAHQGHRYHIKVTPADEEGHGRVIIPIAFQ